MLERGGFSFVALLVINPIAILLYQNCSFLPLAHSEVVAKEMSRPQRTISSVATPEKVDINKLKTADASLGECNPAIQNCPVKGAE